MLVSELIEILQTKNQNAIVRFRDGGDGSSNWIEDLDESDIHEWTFMQYHEDGCTFVDLGVF